MMLGSRNATSAYHTHHAGSPAGRHADLEGTFAGIIKGIIECQSLV
jgi:hypothetical protein